jgi:tetratricopeptide (TPR) repeat protein
VHLDAAIGHAERLEVRLEDAAHLLDRLAVYYREVDNDAPAAVEAGERAIALADRAGRPDPEEYAIYLGNYAMALRFAHRMPDAVAAMDRSLEVTRDSLGTEHEEYVGSLGIKGSILGSWKRYAEAREARQEALTIIRRVMARRPEPAVRQTMVEILNDYAAFLLRGAPDLPEDAPGQAVALLDEALAQLDRGDYVWRQVAMDRARRCRAWGSSRPPKRSSAIWWPTAKKRTATRPTSCRSPCATWPTSWRKWAVLSTRRCTCGRTKSTTKSARTRRPILTTRCPKARQP